jgi:hypothetical protein
MPECYVGVILGEDYKDYESYEHGVNFGFIGFE